MLLDYLIDILENKLNQIGNQIGYDFLEDIEKEYTFHYADKLLILYLSFKNRTIPTGVNFTIELSDEAKDSYEQLSNECKDNFNHICNLLENGEDLKPYQSKHISDINDNLLFNWKINHFHLSPDSNTQDEYFKDRSPFTVLFIIYGGTIYIVDIINHPNGYKWMIKDYLTIAMRNWPFIYEKYKVRSVENISIDRSDEDIYKLAKAHIIQNFEFNGNLYAPPGGGVTTDGTSRYVVEEANDIFRRVFKAQEIIDNQEKLKQFGFEEIESTEFILKLDSDGCLYFYEVNSNSKIFLIYCF